MVSPAHESGQAASDILASGSSGDVGDVGKICAAAESGRHDLALACGLGWYGETIGRREASCMRNELAGAAWVISGFTTSGQGFLLPRVATGPIRERSLSRPSLIGLRFLRGALDKGLDSGITEHDRCAIGIPR